MQSNSIGLPNVGGVSPTPTSIVLDNSRLRVIGQCESVNQYCRQSLALVLGCLAMIDDAEKYLLPLVDSVCFGAVLTDQQLRDLSDWLIAEPAVYSLLRQHGLDMIAWDVLSSAKLPVSEALGKQAKVIAASQVAAEYTYYEVITALKRAGLTPIVQKGFWLSNTVYPHPRWRRYADLDLLLEPDALQMADTVLRGLDFEAIYSALPGQRQLPGWVDGNQIDAAEYRRGLFHVDLHFRVVPFVLPSKANNQSFFDRSMEHSLVLENFGSAVEVRSLDPVDTVLHLALHAAYHNMEHGLRALMDIALVQQFFMRSQGSWQWASVVQRAVDYDLQYLVAGPLWLFHECFGEARLPEAFLQKLDGGEKMRRRYLDEEFKRQFFTAPHTLAEGQRNFWTPMRGAGLKRSIRAGLTHVFPPPGRLAARYGHKPGEPSLYFRYVTRPFYLAYKYGPGLLVRPRQT